MAKTRSKLNCHEKFPKNLSFGVDFKQLIPPIMYKINTHNISGVKSKAVILAERL